MKEYTPLPDIEEWLTRAGLPEYIPNFKFNNVDTLGLLSLEEWEVERLGIVSIGHKKRFAAARVEFIRILSRYALDIRKRKLQSYAKKAIWIIVALGLIASAIVNHFAQHQTKALTGNYFLNGLIITTGVLIFLLPTWIASWRGHHRVGQIIFINIVLVETVLGWPISLAMAFGAINLEEADIIQAMATRSRDSEK